MFSLSLIFFNIFLNAFNFGLILNNLNQFEKKYLQIQKEICDNKKHCEVKIKLDEGAVMPTLGSERSACYDLYSNESKDILPNEISRFKTGIYFEIMPENVHCEIHSRSGNAFNKRLLVYSVGIIDNDYRGEIIVVLKNDSSKTISVKKGEKIAQIGFVRYETVSQFNVVTELLDTERSSKGFGSTDI